MFVKFDRVNLKNYINYLKIRFKANKKLFKQIEKVF